MSNSVPNGPASGATVSSNNAAVETQQNQLTVVQAPQVACFSFMIKGRVGALNAEC